MGREQAHATGFERMLEFGQVLRAEPGPVAVEGHLHDLGFDQRPCACRKGGGDTRPFAKVPGGAGAVAPQIPPHQLSLRLSRFELGQLPADPLVDAHKGRFIALARGEAIEPIQRQQVEREVA